MVRGADGIRKFLEDGKRAVDTAGRPLITDGDEAFVHRTMELLAKHGFDEEDQTVLYLTDDYGWQACSAISKGIDDLKLRNELEGEYYRAVLGKRGEGETRTDFLRAKAAMVEKMDGLQQDEWVGLQMEKALEGTGYLSSYTIEKAADEADDELAAVKMVPREHRAVAVMWRQPGTFSDVTLDLKAGRFYEYDVDLDYSPIHWTDDAHWAQCDEAIKKAKGNGLEIPKWREDAHEYVSEVVADEEKWFQHMDSVLGEAAGYRDAGSEFQPVAIVQA